MDYKHKYTMGSTMGYCITVHMKEYSSAGTLWTIPWALLHHGMQRNGWTHSSEQVYHGQYYGTLVYCGTHDRMEKQHAGVPWTIPWDT